MAIKVKMVPRLSKQRTNGIMQVIAAYRQYLPARGIEFVETHPDIVAAHAGSTGAEVDVAHCHGLYWTADYAAPDWEFKANQDVIEALRHARLITVPSEWVAETIRRDMHVNPYVVPHGIQAEAWQPLPQRSNYVLYNKNRQGDVCDSSPMDELARLSPNTPFVATFGDTKSNVQVTGVLPHEQMKSVVRNAGVYLSTTKETFGIGTLEAMAAGVPVLGYRWGGTAELVKHGVTGYLAEPGNIDDLLEGLRYCQEYGTVLGRNSSLAAREWNWERVADMVANIYQEAIAPSPATVAIIIPTYNYAQFLPYAIESALNQDYEHIEVIVVNDGSTDNTDEVMEAFKGRVTYIKQQNQGVANARNNGIRATDAKYVCCLDADDLLQPNYISTLVPHLEEDRSLGIAYSRLMLLKKDGDKVKGGWPNESDFNKQLAGQNQVPTCCLYRREAWARVGGYKQRYAPLGCGTEDAEFWLRIGKIGYDAKLVTRAPLFIYRLGGRTNGNPEYTEVNWLEWHPDARDGQHPFASRVTPKKHSHSVRQYDTPLVSIVIPVGPGHQKHVIEALDSVEAQTVRQWEIVVVWDGHKAEKNEEGIFIIEDEDIAYIQKAYPFAKFIWTGDKPVGAGAARNIGAKAARAPFLLFLDADDWLLPEALQTMLAAYTEQKEAAIIYTASTGLQAVDEAGADKYRQRGELLSYKRGKALIHQKVAEYDYERAVHQPFTEKPYFWCYISSLVPKQWHEDIGGFDESLVAWEDWDYWIRMAKAARPFVAVNVPCLTYSYDAGYRRQYGASIKDELKQQLIEKHKGIEIMACRSCGGRSPVVRQNPDILTQERIASMNDEQFVLIEYRTPRRGAHGVVGLTVFGQKIAPNMRGARGGWVFDYGHRSQGDRFLVHKDDMRQMSTWFVPVQVQQATRAVQVPVQRTATPAPKPVKLVPEKDEKEVVFDLQSLPGVTPAIATELANAGLTTPEEIQRAGQESLEKIKGLGPVKASAILQQLALHPEQGDPDDILAQLKEILGDSSDVATDEPTAQ